MVKVPNQTPAGPPPRDILDDLAENSSISTRRDRKSNAATGASAASIRALGSQAVAFYFRAPAKAFFRTRVDYLAFARAINPRVQAQEGWSIRMSTPGLLTHAVRTYGWNFIPNHVLPPLLANIGVGAVLYTSYLQILGNLHPPSSHSLKTVYPPPSPKSTFIAGFSAGLIQSVVAAPLDALSVRFRTSDILSGRYKTMWQYAYLKIREIGPRGVFAGWGLNSIRDSLSYGAFFAAFEYVKAQAYYSSVIAYYDKEGSTDPTVGAKGKGGEIVRVIKPHYALGPTFLLLAGVSASFSSQLILHPLERIQNIHYHTLPYLDTQSRVSVSKKVMLRNYCAAYRRTYATCRTRAKRAGGWRLWLYRGFWWNAIRQVPSTSAGLVIFELVRRRYGEGDGEGIRIRRDGYDVLLT